MEDHDSVVHILQSCGIDGPLRSLSSIYIDFCFIADNQNFFLVDNTQAIFTSVTTKSGFYWILVEVNFKLW